jgi:hypothetical protein
MGDLAWLGAAVVVGGLAWLWDLVMRDPAIPTIHQTRDQRRDRR